MNTQLWVYELTLPRDGFPLYCMLCDRRLFFFALLLQAPCIKGLLPIGICSRRYLKISCPVFGERYRGNYRNLIVSLSQPHCLSLLGWHFQSIKGYVGQASPPRRAVGTWIFCSLCGCLEDIPTGQLHLHKTSSVIWSSLISRKQRGRQDRDSFRSLLRKR